MATEQNHNPDNMPERYFQVKITLTRFRPKSWRTMCVPANLNAEAFKDIILRLFGWYGDHLYNFEGYEDVQYMLRKPDFDDYADEDEYEEETDEVTSDTDDDDDYDFPLEEEADDDVIITVKDLFENLGTKLRFVYDFGDYHLHTVELMNSDFTPESGQYPVYCIKSKGGHGIDDGSCEDWTDDEYDKIFDDNGEVRDYDVFEQIMEDCAKRVSPMTANADIAGIVECLYDRKLVYGDPCVVLSKADAAAMKKAMKEQEKAKKAKEKAEQKALKAAEKAKKGGKSKATSAKSKEA